ncbi:MAG: hypothetical protein H6Q72_3356 [Firmicutes bacterium]|nr:hypothetical protein [Bacillota bacterium]
MQGDSISKAQWEVNLEKEVMQRSGVMIFDEANNVQANGGTPVCVELQQLAESIELVYGKIGALDNDAPDVAQIIEQITAIAKEIIVLVEYEIPTMKKM